MNKDELIVTLTHELYNLKHKLIDIKSNAETARFNLSSPNGVKTNALVALLDIIHAVDLVEE